jgi:hypothetical protein
MNMTVEAFKAICRDIIVNMKYGNGANTFAWLSTNPDVNTSSLGFTHRHYLAGDFWSRNWVNAGANANDVIAQYPILAIEPMTISVEDSEHDNLEQQFYVVVFDKVECPSCPDDEIRTEATIKANAANILRAFFRELIDYRLYNYDFDGDSGLTGWFSKGKVEYLESLPGGGGYVFHEFTSEAIAWVEAYDLELQDWEFDGIRFGVAARLRVNFCDPLDVDFDYGQELPSELAAKICC